MACSGASQIRPPSEKVLGPSLPSVTFGDKNYSQLGTKLNSPDGMHREPGHCGILEFHLTGLPKGTRGASLLWPLIDFDFLKSLDAQ